MYLTVIVPHCIMRGLGVRLWPTNPDMPAELRELKKEMRVCEAMSTAWWLHEQTFVVVVVVLLSERCFDSVSLADNSIRGEWGADVTAPFGTAMA